MLTIDTNKMIDLYQKEHSVRRVAASLGISHETVRTKLKASGVLDAPLSRYACQDDFFSTDTIESFYWAGFIAADGCVKLDDGHKYLSIGLNNRDHAHLDKFKFAIKFAGPVGTVNRIDCISAEISIRSDQVFDDLARFNIVPRKSLTLTFPQWLIGHDLVHHFMRGYNDGDGCFFIQRLKGGRTVKQLMFSLRGTKEFLTTYRDILETKCEFKHNDKKPRANSGIYSLEYGGNRKVLKIRDFLYKDAINDIVLDRKYELAFSEQFNLPENFKLKPVIGVNINTREEVMFRSMKEAMAHGFLYQGIGACCRGKYKSHKGYTWKYAN